MHVTAIIAAAGAGRRLGGAVPKQLLEIGGVSLLARSVAAFDTHSAVSDVIVALPPELAAARDALIGETRQPVRVVAGGARRQDSVAAAAEVIDAACDVVLVHDAARPFVSADLISRAIAGAVEHGAAIAALKVSDTVKRVEAPSSTLIVETLPRERIFLAQTPQAFRREVFMRAVAVGRAGVEATDEAALAERAGFPVHVISGDPRNVKITTAGDLEWARQAHAEVGATTSRVGTGYDLHRLVEGRPLVLGGVTVPSACGALGHSDADVVCHAVTDAILGAACLGDIGRHFPDTDPRWKDAASIDLLGRAATLVREASLQVVNVDVVVVLERPKIAPFLDAIRGGVAGALEIDVANVAVKGKTNEGVDAIGRGEAIAAHAVALLCGS
jgi:2-C-methyl-D-erythritol 4-phosphate cytidylyltransferase / 2-C-methyl-D-erythritol 2,4-cyclodiphosphate synthase